MPWINLSTNDVLAVMNNTEVNAYQQFRPAAGQADPLATLIAHVTAEIRGVLRRRHTLDAGGGIPSSLAGAACAMIVHRLLLRCNAKPGESRQAENFAAGLLVQRAGDGEVGIELAANATSEPTSISQPIVTRRRLESAPEGEEGWE